jgi:hypothetical protein
MKKHTDTFVHESGNERLDDMRQFIIDHDITKVPQTVYHIIECLWPDLIHKVKPPRERMH